MGGGGFCAPWETRCLPRYAPLRPSRPRLTCQGCGNRRPPAAPGVLTPWPTLSPQPPPGVPAWGPGGVGERWRCLGSWALDAVLRAAGVGGRPGAAPTRPSPASRRVAPRRPFPASPIEPETARRPDRLGRPLHPPSGRPCFPLLLVARPRAHPRTSGPRVGGAEKEDVDL